MAKLIDAVTVVTRDGKRVAGDRKTVAMTIEAAVRRGRKPRRPH